MNMDYSVKGIIERQGVRGAATLDKKRPLDELNRNLKIENKFCKNKIKNKFSVNGLASTKILRREGI